MDMPASGESNRHHLTATDYPRRLTAPSLSPGELLTRLWHTIRAVLAPGLILQSLALALVLGWYLVPDFRALLNLTAQMREAGGLFFSAMVFALAGGVIPVLVQALRCDRTWRSVIPDASYLAWAWMALGLATDALYRMQQFLFGNAVDLPTLLMKTGFDQFVWTPFFVIPFFRIIYGLMERNYVFSSALLPLDPRWFQDAALNLVANWLVWIPTVFLIYALPLALQIPFAAVMVCFYSLLMLSMAKSAPAPEGQLS